MMIRTMDMQDSNFDGIDDRDQKMNMGRGFPGGPPLFPNQDRRARPPQDRYIHRGGNQGGIGSFPNPFGGFMGGGRGNFMRPQPPMYGGGFGGFGMQSPMFGGGMGYGMPPMFGGGMYGGGFGMQPPMFGGGFGSPFGQSFYGGIGGMFPGMGGGYGMQRPPSYGGFGGGYNRPMPQPIRPMPIQIGEPVRGGIKPLPQPPRLIMKEPIDRIGNYGLNRRFREIKANILPIQTQSPESMQLQPF